MLQKSNLHTVFECSSPLTKTLLGQRHNGKFLWASAVALRHNSTQIPVDSVESTPVIEVAYSPPVIQISPVSSSAETVLSQPVTEQITVKAVSVASPEVDITPPQTVLNSISEQVSADLTPVLPQPITEQVADAAPIALDVLQAASVELSLSELGLAAFSPVGLVQSLLEYFHVNLGLPWWGAIVVGTALARVIVFPVIVKGQREAAKLNNHLPEITKLTNKMNEAKTSGNKFEFARAHSQLNLYQKKHEINPLRGLLIPLVQAPIYVSFFMALRQMAYLPVPSLQTGGVLWFPDLTIADPLYILPLVVTGSMYFILKLGAETGIDNPNLKVMKNVFRVMPLFFLPFIVHFPTAVFTYWLTSNCISLGQVALLRHPLVREKLRIPERVQHSPSALPENEGFIKSLKKGWNNAKMAHLIEERERRIKNVHERAGQGPLKQTFTHNPLLQNQPVAAATSKDKEALKRQLWKDTLG